MKSRMKQAVVQLHNKIGRDSTWGYKALLQNEFLISCVPLSAVKAPALPYFMSTNFAAFLFLWFLVVTFAVLLPYNFQRSWLRKMGVLFNIMLFVEASEVVTWGVSTLGGDSSDVYDQLNSVAAIYSTSGAFA